MPANRGDGGGVLFGQRESWLRCPGACHEELHSVRVIHSGGSGGREIRKDHGWHRETVLAGKVQRRATGNEDRQCGTSREQIGDENGRGEDVLEIVEDQEQLPVA